MRKGAANRWKYESNLRAELALFVLYFCKCKLILKILHPNTYTYFKLTESEIRS